MVHELRVIAAVKLHLNVTYAQDRAFKSVDEKSWWEMSGKLIFSYRTMFKLAQGFRDSKTRDVNALVPKEVVIILIMGHYFK